MNKKDYFYYGKLNGIPIYFQPEENEVVPRNKLCAFLLTITVPFFVLQPNFAICIQQKTITRSELIQKGLIQEGEE